MSEYRRVEESFGESPSARQAGLPAGPGLGASRTRRRFWATAVEVALRSSCGLNYAHPPSAAGLVAWRNMSELMPPVIAVVGTCLVPPLAMGRPSSPGVAACGRRTANHACTMNTMK